MTGHSSFELKFNFFFNLCVSSILPATYRNTDDRPAAERNQLVAAETAAAAARTAISPGAQCAMRAEDTARDTSHWQVPPPNGRCLRRSLVDRPKIQ